MRTYLALIYDITNRLNTKYQDSKVLFLPTYHITLFDAVEEPTVVTAAACDGVLDEDLVDIEEETFVM